LCNFRRHGVKKISFNVYEHDNAQTEIHSGNVAIDGDAYNSDSDHEDSDMQTDNPSFQEPEDDTGVPLQVVINAALGGQVINGSHEVSRFILNPNVIEEDANQNLQVVGEMENMWSYDDRDGCVWSKVMAEGGTEELEDMYMTEYE
jgi:hypothetical protein